MAPVTTAQQRTDPVGALSALGVRLITSPRRSTREREVVSGLRADPRLLMRLPTLPIYAAQTALLSVAMGPAITRALDCSPDIVSIEHDTSAALGERVPDYIPRVLTAQNVTPAYYASRRDSKRGVHRLAYAIESRRATQFISRWLQTFDQLIAMSESDAQLLRAYTQTPVTVIPNGAVIGPSLPAPSRANATVLFTGTMNHPPNRDGILWFHARVWPQVRSLVTDAQLTIVGRHPDPEVRALADRDPSVRVMGEVPDMSPFLAEAALLVAPLHAGGGTRLKILDAFAAERAVVSTTIGAEGIAVTHGEHLLIADKPTDFADATVQLLRDHSLRAAIARSGRQLAEERYDWLAVGEDFSRLLQQVVSRRYI